MVGHEQMRVLCFSGSFPTQGGSRLQFSLQDTGKVFNVLERRVLTSQRLLISETVQGKSIPSPPPPHRGFLSQHTRQGCSRSTPRALTQVGGTRWRMQRTGRGLWWAFLTSSGRLALFSLLKGYHRYQKQKQPAIPEAEEQP